MLLKWLDFLLKVIFNAFPVQSPGSSGYTTTMPIIKTSYDANVDPETLFRGRVLKIERTTETRNWSDTMDYSDHRSTECTWALVYIGTYGVPPRGWNGRVITHIKDASWETPRDLTVGERFAWVDCTNLFGDRHGYLLKAEVDTVGDLLIAGGTENIYDQLAAWEVHHKAALEARVAEHAAKEAIRLATEAAAAEKAAARQAKKDAKEAVLKAEAEKLLARIPAKGTQVTVDGFTGKVFWVGVSKYYGKFNARAGVKDAKGNVVWVEAAKF